MYTYVFSRFGAHSKISGNLGETRKPQFHTEFPGVRQGNPTQSCANASHYRNFGVFCTVDCQLCRHLLRIVCKFYEFCTPTKGLVLRVRKWWVPTVASLNSKKHAQNLAKIGNPASFCAHPDDCCFPALITTARTSLQVRKHNTCSLSKTTQRPPKYPKVGVHFCLDICWAARSTINFSMNSF